VAAIWSILADLVKPAKQQEGFIRLCASTLLLYLLLALAWALNDGATALVQGISGLMLSYLAIPLVLLLVAAVAAEQTTEYVASQQAPYPSPTP
jgi:bacteriorhodopsin